MTKTKGGAHAEQQHLGVWVGTDVWGGQQPSWASPRACRSRRKLLTPGAACGPDWGGPEPSRAGAVSSARPLWPSDPGRALRQPHAHSAGWAAAFLG